MTRFAIAAVLAAALHSTAGAQPAPSAPPPPAPVAEPLPAAPVATVPVGPALTYYKSGGFIIGADGFYPYDTGNWLLGGTEGLTRQRGTFRMEVTDEPLVGAPAPGHFHGKHRLFRR